MLERGTTTTYPDRPPVAATSLNDTPLKVERREELPAGNLPFELVIFCKGKSWRKADPHKEAIHDVPKLRDRHFKKKSNHYTVKVQMKPRNCTHGYPRRLQKDRES